MNALAISPLLAQATRTVFRLGRLDQFTEWWHWLLLAAVVIAIGAYVVYMYIRDGVELPRGLAGGLLVLRLAVLAGLVFYFLQLERRTEQKLVRNSRVLVLVDTSQSMNQKDSEKGRRSDSPSRIEQVVSALQQGSWLSELRSKHEVVVYRLAPQPIGGAPSGETASGGAAPPEIVASIPKIAPPGGTTDDGDAPPSNSDERHEMRTLLAAGAGVLAVAVLLSAIHFAARRPKTEEATSWLLLAGMVLLIAGGVTLAVAQLRHPQIGLAELWREPSDNASSSSSTDASSDAADGSSKPAAPLEKIDWAAKLTATGGETRLLDAVRFLVNQERGGTAAGIIVLSDGGNNAGLREPAAVAVGAKDAHVPIFTVGLGTDEQPKNVRLVDLEAPPRAYPGDPFPVKGFVQGFGVTGGPGKLAAFPVEVELVSQPLENGKPTGQERVEGKATVQLKGDGLVEKVEFTVESPEVGVRLFTLRQTGQAAKLARGETGAPPANPQEAEKLGLIRSAKVQVVQRKNKVLLLAGGPTREYQFLRNQLFRDKQTTVHVLLQTGKPGQSQDAHDLLNELPSDPDELFEYDCIVAFDPDWNAVDAKQVELLERFVAEKAGGLILAAGPVHTPHWTNVSASEDSKIRLLKALYPVVYYSQATGGIRLGKFGSEQAWPLKFTPEGTSAEFLWIAENARKSEEAWNGFAGVYGYYSVKDVKQGATVLAYYSDPDAAIGNQAPVYFASQFYGTGRVFYMASGEMWRLRASDERYFEQFYTKLIRWASQGRLLLDSTRGVLLADKDRAYLGETITVRASLTDPQHQPLMQAEVSGLLVQPDGVRRPLVLKKVKDLAREGMYSAQFPAGQEGTYRVELPLPKGDAAEVLSREVRVRLPTLEIERPERDDALLSGLALGSGGAYYVGLPSMQGEGNADALTKLLTPQDQETYLPGSPDRPFDQKLMGWMIAGLCGLLSLEWLLRRLNKLA